MEKDRNDALPSYREVVGQWSQRRRRHRFVCFAAVVAILYFGCFSHRIAGNAPRTRTLLNPERLKEDLDFCKVLQRAVKDPSGPREQNQRWNRAIKPVLIRNATIWTGEPRPGTSAEEAKAGEGFFWVRSDVLMDRGLIVEVKDGISNLPEGTTIFDAKGRQLTAGIVDMHSHAGLGAIANLDEDDNELSADITPHVQSIDGLNPIHPELEWIKSGGVTTSLLLPGSGNNMGGEAFVIKLAVGNASGRTEISQEDLLADPERNWRYMKMACGENPKRVYGRLGKQGPFSRLGEAWEFRHALEQARKYVQSQDDWCAAARTIKPENMPVYLPRELRWDSLGALLRGQVRLNTHCYTIPDLEAFVRHTNEFKFQLRAFHHAHQTYLVPGVLKRAYGGTPAVALFADNMYYKVEAYTASERAGQILYDMGITPVYVSDNPVLNAQHLVFEAAKAYTFGLPYHAALASVTSAPAELLGLGERVGKVIIGFDADVVVWDSDPLAVAATPIQVWIDGASQFDMDYQLDKHVSPPIEPDYRLSHDLRRKDTNGQVVFTGVKEILLPGFENLVQDRPTFNVVVAEGSIICVGSCTKFISAATSQRAPCVKLRSGFLSPSFTAFGSSLGMVEIDAERDTHDGDYSKAFSRAIDGLALDGKQLLAAYEHGVTQVISAPSKGGVDARGVSAGFRTGALNAAEYAAVWAEEVAVHYTLTLDAKDDTTASISSAIGHLRSKLLTAVAEYETNETIKLDRYDEKHYLHRVVKGSLPLVITVHSADTIASIIRLKAEVEDVISATSTSYAPAIRLTLLGGAEAHIVANDLAKSNISVVLAPPLPHAARWDQRRSLTGAPITNGTTLDRLLDTGVKVAIGVDEMWMTRELGWFAGWAAKNHRGGLSKKNALALVGRNIYDILGLQQPNYTSEWTIWDGSPLETGNRLRAVGSQGRVSYWI